VTPTDSATGRPWVAFPPPRSGPPKGGWGATSRVGGWVSDSSHSRQAARWVGGCAGGANAPKFASCVPKSALKTHILLQKSRQRIDIAWDGALRVAGGAATSAGAWNLLAQRCFFFARSANWWEGGSGTCIFLSWVGRWARATPPTLWRSAPRGRKSDPLGAAINTARPEPSLCRGKTTARRFPTPSTSSSY
jgi:hypothetical protein